MSATDYRRLIDTLGGGFIAVECSDGEHVGINANIVYLDLKGLDALLDTLSQVRAVITPKMIDGNLDRRPN